MADRPHDACSSTVIIWLILRGWLTLRLNFRLKGYALCQYLCTVWWRNGYTTTLVVEVFTQKIVTDFIWLKLNFIKKQKTLSEPFFGDLGVTYVLLYLVGKAVVNFLFVYNGFFAVSYGWRIVSGNLSKLACFDEGWVTLSANFRRKGATVGVRKLEWLPFHVQKYPRCTVWFCHKARVWQTDRQTDRQTDGQNYDS